MQIVPEYKTSVSIYATPNHVAVEVDATDAPGEEMGWVCFWKGRQMW